MNSEGVVENPLTQQTLTAAMHQSRSLWLRRTVPEDAETLFHLGFSQREFMRLFRLNDEPKSVAAVRQTLAKRQQLSPNQDRYLELLIIHKRHGPIGLCALADYAPLHKRAEYLVGLFNLDKRSVGYGIETTIMVLDLAFNQYGMNKVCAIAYGYNQPAQSVLSNIGFVLEGRRREHCFDPIAQVFIDFCDYGMTAADFCSSSLLARLSQRFLQRDITQMGPIPQSNAHPISHAHPVSRVAASSMSKFAHSGIRLLRAPPSG